MESLFLFIRYFPSTPVQCTNVIGSGIPNQGAEAYVELAKALNTLGDYRLSTPLNACSWTSIKGVLQLPTSRSLIYNEYDGTIHPVTYLNDGTPFYIACEAAYARDGETALSGSLYGGRNVAGVNSSCFACAINLETSNGLEISGLNAEEQSDITLTLKYSVPQDNAMQYIVYTYFDVMLILFQNNVIQIIR